MSTLQDVYTAATIDYGPNHVRSLRQGTRDTLSFETSARTHVFRFEMRLYGLVFCLIGSQQSATFRPSMLQLER